MSAWNEWWHTFSGTFDTILGTFREWMKVFQGHGMYSINDSHPQRQLIALISLPRIHPPPPIEKYSQHCSDSWFVCFSSVFYKESHHKFIAERWKYFMCTSTSIGTLWKYSKFFRVNWKQNRHCKFIQPDFEHFNSIDIATRYTDKKKRKIPHATPYTLYLWQTFFSCCRIYFTNICFIELRFSLEKIPFARL